MLIFILRFKLITRVLRTQLYRSADVVSRLLATIPGPGKLSADIIVVASRRAEEDFEDTFLWSGEAGYSSAYTFIYS